MAGWTAANPALTTRLLDRIERVGNRMPSPTVLVLLLCVGTIALSQALFWLNVHATYETVTPPPVATMETYNGGSVEPSYVGPTQPEAAAAYKLHTATTEVQGLLTAHGVRFLFASFVSNFRDFAPLAILLIVMIAIIFFVAGWCYGKGARTLRDSDDVIDGITRSWASLAGLLLLFLLIAQFIAYFNFSHIPDVAAVKLGDLLEHIHIGAVWLLIGVIVIAAAANFVIPQAIAKWALLAPVFIPLFIRLGIAPQTVLAAFRVGDSPTNVITPLNPYLALVVVFAQRYDKNSGVGTLISMMLPYTIVLMIAWTLLFIAWYLIGIPLGPGWSAHL